MKKESAINYTLETMDSRDSIPFRRSNRYIAGSINGALLLEQIVYWYGKMGNKPFYKIKQPCDSPQYKPGQSWCEELGFTRREFDHSLNLIGQKISSNIVRDENILVHYWVDFRRLTFYEVNMELYVNLKNEYYEKEIAKLSSVDNEQTRKGGNVLYDDRKGGNVLYVKAESAFSVKAESATGSIIDNLSENTAVCVVNPAPETHSHTQLASLLTTNPECQEIFNFRFSEYDVVIDELADSCIKFYAPKEVSVLTFKTWIRREKIENFQKKGKQKIISQHRFTDQEQDIAGQYRQAKKDNLIETWYPSAEKREQARLIFERVYKCPN